MCYFVLKFYLLDTHSAGEHVHAVHVQILYDSHGILILMAHCTGFNMYRLQWS